MKKTRVATLMFAKDVSPASYPASGNRAGFHGASHHANVKANMDNFALINKYHVQMLSYFIEKLASTPMLCAAPLSFTRASESDGQTRSMEFHKTAQIFLLHCTAGTERSRPLRLPQRSNIDI